MKVLDVRGLVTPCTEPDDIEPVFDRVTEMVVGVQALAGTALRTGRRSFDQSLAHKSRDCGMGGDHFWMLSAQPRPCLCRARPTVCDELETPPFLGSRVARRESVAGVLRVALVRGVVALPAFIGRIALLLISPPPWPRRHGSDYSVVVA